MIFLLCSMFIFAVDGAAAADKPFTLQVLNIIQEGGVKPDNGKACKAAAQLVVDTVNSRSDILADYRIEMMFQDEGGGMKPPGLVTGFAIGWENQDLSKARTYPSPVVIGPFISTGCKAIGPLLHHLNLVDISTGCGALSLVDKTRYPNLYLMLSAVSAPGITILHFLKEIGEYSRVALLTNAANLNDYSTAINIEKVANSLGVTIPFFSIVIEITDDVMWALKESDSRIIVSYMAQNQFVWQLLCQSYKYGLTGPKYLFVVNGIDYTDPLSLKAEILPGCLRSTVIEQLKYSFWVSPITLDSQPLTKSSLGYDSIEFDSRLDQYFNKTHPGDYDLRFLCHDTVIRSVFALEATEKALHKLNLSLRDYANNPKLVSKIVNDSVASLSYKGLIMGQVYNDSKGQLYTEKAVMSYWTRQNGLQTIYRAGATLNSDETSYGSYHMQNIHKFSWGAWGGTKPLQQRNVKKVLSEVNPAVFQLALGLGIIFFTFQFIILIITIAVEKWNVEANEIPLSGRSKCVGYIGCLLLNCTSIAFSAESGVYAAETWVLRICLLVISTEIIYTVVGLRVMTLAIELRHFCSRPISGDEQAPIAAVQRSTPPKPPYRPTRHSISQSNPNNPKGGGGSSHADTSASSGPVKKTVRINEAPEVVPPPLPQLPIEPPILELPIEIVGEADRLTSGGTMVFLLAKTIVLAIWLFWDPLHCTLTIVEKETLYRADIDTYVETSLSVCKSNYGTAWIVGMIIIHALQLATAFFCQVKINIYCESVIVPELLTIRFAIQNAIILLIATLLVVFSFQDQIKTQTAITISCLIMSFVMSVLLTSQLAGEGYRRFVFFKQQSRIFPSLRFFQ